MPKIPMVLIGSPDPATQTIIQMEGRDPVLTGSTTGHDYTCASCGTVILRAVSKAQASGMVFQCGVCQAFNALPQDVPA